MITAKKSSVITLRRLGSVANKVRDLIKHREVS